MRNKIFSNTAFSSKTNLLKIPLCGYNLYLGERYTVFNLRFSYTHSRISLLACVKLLYLLKKCLLWLCSILLYCFFCQWKVDLSFHTVFRRLQIQHHNDHFFQYCYETISKSWLLQSACHNEENGYSSDYLIHSTFFEISSFSDFLILIMSLFLLASSRRPTLI